MDRSTRGLGWMIAMASLVAACAGDDTSDDQPADEADADAAYSPDAYGGDVSSEAVSLRDQGTDAKPPSNDTGIDARDSAVIVAEDVAIDRTSFDAGADTAVTIADSARGDAALEVGADVTKQPSDGGPDAGDGAVALADASADSAVAVDSANPSDGPNADVLTENTDASGDEGEAAPPNDASEGGDDDGPSGSLAPMSWVAGAEPVCATTALGYCSDDPDNGAYDVTEAAGDSAICSIAPSDANLWFASGGPPSPGDYDVLEATGLVDTFNVAAGKVVVRLRGNNQAKVWWGRAGTVHVALADGGKLAFTFTNVTANDGTNDVPVSGYLVCTH